MGNHLEMNAGAWVKYNMVEFYKGGERRKSQKKHSHDLTEFYKLTMDSTQIVTGRDAMDSIRPVPLTNDEFFLYQYQLARNNSSGWITEEWKEKVEEY